MMLRNGVIPMPPAKNTAGFAVFHGTFSTWECQPGIWLEDLYVPDRYRKAGVGRTLLTDLAALALQRGCPPGRWVFRCQLDGMGIA